MTRNFVAKRIRRFEKRVFPKLRHNKAYKTITGMILIPVALLTYLIDKLIVLMTKEKSIKAKKGINLKNIIDGFAHLAFPNEDVEKIAIARAEICATCPLAVKIGVYSVVVDNRTKVIQGMKCDECGCNLSAKVRSINDSCPLGKW